MTSYLAECPREFLVERYKSVVLEKQAAVRQLLQQQRQRRREGLLR